MGKWRHLGHRLGECWNDKDKSITFIHIPKNASSFVKGCLLSTLAFIHSDTSVNATRYLVILRDPIERWVSGMAEYEYNNKHLNIDYQQITFDDHTETQDYFIHDIEIDKTDFFMINDLLRLNLNHWFAEFGYRVNVDNMKQWNDSDLNIEKQQLKIKYQLIIDNDPVFVLKLKKHYANDYALINRVKFYGT